MTTETTGQQDHFRDGAEKVEGGDPMTMQLESLLAKSDLTLADIDAEIERIVSDCPPTQHNALVIARLERERAAALAEQAEHQGECREETHAHP